MAPSKARLHMFSNFQPNSPIISAPTRRPLPFKVWKIRRTSINFSSLFSGSSCQVRCCDCKWGSSSSNSSTKTSFIKSSASSPKVTRSSPVWGCVVTTSSDGLSASVSASSAVVCSVSSASDSSSTAVSCDSAVSSLSGMVSTARSSCATWCCKASIWWPTSCSRFSLIRLPWSRFSK